MATFIAQRVEEEYRKNGLEAGRNKYRAYFVRTHLYDSVKANVDTILATDGYENCIVTE